MIGACHSAFKLTRLPLLGAVTTAGAAHRRHRVLHLEADHPINPFLLILLLSLQKKNWGGTSQLPHLGSQSTLQTSVDQLDFAEKYLISQAWLYLYNFGKAVFNAQLCRELFLVHNCVESCQSLRVAIIRSRCMG